MTDSLPLMLDETDLAEFMRTAEIEHFTAHEFLAGKRMPSEFLPATIRVLKVADQVRRFVGEPLRLTSGYRPRETNAHVGGASNSSHIYGAAVDLRVSAMAPPGSNERLRLGGALAWIGDSEEVGGLGIYFGNIHIDVRIPNKRRRAWWATTAKPAPKSAKVREEWMKALMGTVVPSEAREQLAAGYTGQP